MKADIRSEYSVPIGWLFALVGACGSALLVSFGIGVFVATLSSKVDAQGQDIGKMQAEDLSARVIRVETLLSIVYPNEYQEALRRAASHAPDRR